MTFFTLFKNWSIGLKVISSLLSVAIISIFVTGFFCYQASKQAMEDSIVENLAILSDAYEGRILEFLDHLKMRVIDFSSDGYIRDITRQISEGDTSERNNLNRHLVVNKMALSEQIYGINVMNLDGIIVASTDSREVGLDESEDEYYLGAKNLHYGIAYLGDVYISNHFGKENLPSLIVSAPLTDKETGKMIGVIANYIKLTDLESILLGERQIELGAPTTVKDRIETLNIYLVDHNGLLITKSANTKGLVFEQKVNVEPVFKCRSMQEMSGFYADFRGVPVVGGSMCLENGWTLLVEISEEEAFAQIEGIKKIIYLLTLLILLGAVIIAYLLTRAITGPIKRLLKVSKKIAGGDFKVQADATAGDEVGELAGGFNEMTKKLRQSYSKLEKKIKELERVIKEREIAEHGLAERMKELTIIYETSRVFLGDADLNDALGEIVKKIPLAYQFPKLACAKIIYNGNKYQTKNFKKTQWGQYQIIRVGGRKVGKIEVFYLKESPFLVEEKKMIKEVASQIGNITERKRNEYRLSKSEGNLNKAQTVAHVGSWHLDIVNNVLTWSDEVYRIFGLKPQQFGATYEVFLNTIHPEDRDLVNNAYTNSLKEKIPYDIEHRIILPDGEERIVREICETDYNKKGKPVQSTGTVQDITERKKSDERIRSLDMLKSRFITALTHVTRTPLSRIRWAIESMLAGDVGDLNEEQETFLRQVLDNEAQILRLITNMNIVLDIERDVLVLDINKTSITSLVRSVVDSFQEECKLEELKCSVISPRADYPPLSIDAEKMRKVMELLISNALRYSKEKGSVSIRFSKAKNLVTIKIIDKGIGIPKAEQANIFGRFFRASNAQSVYPGGVGLGLYIAKSIVEAHGGEIGFKSQEGKGSEFWVKLSINSK